MPNGSITLSAGQINELKNLVSTATSSGTNYSAAYSYVAQQIATNPNADPDTITWYQDAALINGATAGSSVIGDLARNFTSEMIAHETGTVVNPFGSDMQNASNDLAASV